MSFTTEGGIQFFRFGCLGDDVTQAVFTRRGGVSPNPWASLNLGGTVGDDPDRVNENRRLALKALGCDPKSVYDVWQVHGVNVAVAEAPRPPDMHHLQADIILTDRPDITLMMRFADCVPVFIHDPIRRVIGIAHAGWMGTVRGVAAVAIRAMQERFGSHPSDIQAAIGPSIGPDHYEIGMDVVRQVRYAYKQTFPSLLTERNGSFYFDLWEANRQSLQLAGVQKIEISGLCTACNTEKWYSHRAERGRTGRFGAILRLGS
jgi:YfiH family protein